MFKAAIKSTDINDKLTLSQQQTNFSCVSFNHTAHQSDYTLNNAWAKVINTFRIGPFRFQSQWSASHSVYKSQAVHVCAWAIWIEYRSLLEGDLYLGLYTYMYIYSTHPCPIKWNPVEIIYFYIHTLHNRIELSFLVTFENSYIHIHTHSYTFIHIKCTLTSLIWIKIYIVAHKHEIASLYAFFYIMPLWTRI